MVEVTLDLDFAKENIIIDTSNENIKEKNSNKLSFLDRFPFYRQLRKLNK